MTAARTLGEMARQAMALLLNPFGPDGGRARLTPGRAILLQMTVGMLCVVALALRASVLESGNRKFRGSGLAVIIGLALAAQLLAYLAYIYLASGLARAVARNPESSRSALGVVSCSTFPLLLGWLFQVAVVYARHPPGIGSIADVHAFTEATWGALAVRTDVLPSFGSGSGLLALVASALGLFWIWHGVNLWAGLRRSLHVSRAAAAGILVALAAVLVLTSAFGQAFGAHWHEVIVWTD